VASAKRQEREELAAKRIASILSAQGVANLRTLEQKISDAGPNSQRVQPHIITSAKQKLVKAGTIIDNKLDQAHWFHLADEDAARVEARLGELRPVWQDFTSKNVVRRTGQALEIAVFKALNNSGNHHVFGGFNDLADHDDSTLYSKEEVKNVSGKSLGAKSLDFIALVNGQLCGIEVKNVRPWYYAHDPDLREAIGKALTLGAMPVFIARRIQYVTFRVFGTCGVIMHETYNQRMASYDEPLAKKASHKDLLGYHDIRAHNEPDARLQKFVDSTLPSLLENAARRLENYKDLLHAFAFEEMAYAEFAARVRRREAGTKEDNDWEEEEVDPYDRE
jgi:hypothetical protein